MDKVFCGLFVLWAVAMGVGLLIALAPLLLVIAGFILTILILTFLGRLMASWIG